MSIERNREGWWQRWETRVSGFTICHMTMCRRTLQSQSRAYGLMHLNQGSVLWSKPARGCIYIYIYICMEWE